MEQGRRHSDRPWWRDMRFLLPMLLTVAMSLGGGLIGSWIGTSNRLAVLDQISKNLQTSVEELKKQVGNANGALQDLNRIVSQVRSDGDHNTRDITRLQSQIDTLTSILNAYASKAERNAPRGKRAEKEN